MYILDNKKNILTYLFVTTFTIIFSFIYELFSHDVISKYMLLAPLIPFIFGFIISVLINKKYLNKYYHSLIAIITIYMYILGILEIYGTTNKLTNIYLYLIIIYILIYIISLFYKKRKV